MTARVNALTDTGTLAGVTVTIVPAGARVGGFTRPLSVLCDTAEAAIESMRAHRGDVLVRRVLTESREGWQAFGRTRSVGGKDRHQTGSGSRGRRVSDGAARVFYQPRH